MTGKRNCKDCCGSNKPPNGESHNNVIPDLLRNPQSSCVAYSTHGNDDLATQVLPHQESAYFSPLSPGPSGCGSSKGSPARKAACCRRYQAIHSFCNSRRASSLICLILRGINSTMYPIPSETAASNRAMSMVKPPAISEKEGYFSSFSSGSAGGGSSKGSPARNAACCRRYQAAHSRCFSHLPSFFSCLILRGINSTI